MRRRRNRDVKHEQKRVADDGAELTSAGAALKCAVFGTLVLPKSDKVTKQADHGRCTIVTRPSAKGTLSAETQHS